jgi:hypothetical protein
LSNQVPETVAFVAETMASYPGRWALSGGWAVDAWLGRETRDHGDIDVSVFLDERQVLHEHLAGWELVSHDAFKETNELWDGRLLALPAHLHARLARPGEAIPPAEPLLADRGFVTEFVFNELTAGGEWVLYFTPPDGKSPAREPLVTIPFARAVQESRYGVPTLAPEAVLFYKATAYRGTRHYLRRRDHEDFERLLPRLSREERSWLADAITRVEVDHPWLGVISL